MPFIISSLHLVVFWPRFWSVYSRHKGIYRETRGTLKSISTVNCNELWLWKALFIMIHVTLAQSTTHFQWKTGVKWPSVFKLIILTLIPLTQEWWWGPEDLYQSGWTQFKFVQFKFYQSLCIRGELFWWLRQGMAILWLL